MRTQGATLALAWHIEGAYVCGTVLLDLSTCPSWCSHSAFTPEENLLAGRSAWNGSRRKRHRRRKCSYVANVADRWTKMKTEKYHWNLAAVLVTGNVLGRGRALIRVCNILKYFPM